MIVAEPSDRQGCICPACHGVWKSLARLRTRAKNCLKTAQTAAALVGLAVNSVLENTTAAKISTDRNAMIELIARSGSTTV